MITYFLLCGYTPFDRDSNLEEMQAILVADYSFTPLEYWRSVSLSAREFIKRCLTIDPKTRMTAHQALSHPFVDMEKRAELERQRRESGAGGMGAMGQPQEISEGGDLLPVIKKNFNARRTLHAAIDTIRAINKLREGGAAGLMEGAMSQQPSRHEGGGNNNNNNNNGNNNGNGKANRAPPPPSTAGAGGADAAGAGGDSMEGVEQTGSSAKLPPGSGKAAAGARAFDPRGHARGQTEEMIRAQQKRVEETAKGLWQPAARAM